MKEYALDTLNIKCAKCKSEYNMHLVARDFENFRMIDTYLCSACGFKIKVNNEGETK